MADEDPRKNPLPVSVVPRLLAEGAAHYHARRFWHAHEAWEAAWHALRAAEDGRAPYVRGMILATAAFENAVRQKEAGSKRQLAESLHALLAHKDAGESLLENAHDWEQSLVRLYVDMCRRRRWEHWNEGDWEAPPIRLRGP